MAKEHPIGIAFHQWPKQGNYRRFLKAPPGYFMIAADVDSQETKLMADYSRDAALLEIYAKGLNPHTLTASKISGAPYQEIEAGCDKDEKLEILYKGGKVTDLGENYRMGTRTLWNNAHVQWGLTPTLAEAGHWKKVWRSTYTGVPAQWDRFIELARFNGYAETLAGRRYYIDDWGKSKWKSEASAIMVPIQGSGAEMKYLAIAVMRHRFPHMKFWDEIHDEIIYLCPTSYDLLAACRNVKHALDNLPYKEAWDWEPVVQFTWTVAYGDNWGDMEKVK